MINTKVPAGAGVNCLLSRGASSRAANDIDGNRKLWTDGRLSRFWAIAAQAAVVSAGEGLAQTRTDGPAKTLANPFEREALVQPALHVHTTTSDA